MRALIVGPDQRTAIAKLTAFAAEHVFIPGTGVIPGDNPEYVTHVPDGFRCVFTITKYEGKLFRHLTVSVNGPLLPSPEACIVLAKEFGFRSSDAAGFDLIGHMESDGWLIGEGHPGENCIAIAQPVEDHV